MHRKIFSIFMIMSMNIVLYFGCKNEPSQMRSESRGGDKLYPTAFSLK